MLTHCFTRVDGATWFKAALDSAFEQVINPILDEHPDLKPDQLNVKSEELD